jgi:integrase
VEPTDESMPKAKLNKRKLESLKPGDAREDYWDTKLPGFGVRVSPEGTNTFFVMYRFAGMRRRMNLGRYPDLPVPDARKQANDALNKVRDGKDPVQEKKAAEAKARRERLEAKTFSQLAKQYVDEYAKSRKKSWAEDEWILDKYLKPEFGTLNVKEITRTHVRSFLRSLATRTPVQANRTQSCLRKLFNWAIDNEIVNLENNPATHIEPPGGKEKPKERALNDDELKAVWQALEKETSQVKDVLRLILLTGQRPGEVMGARLDEINFNEALWTIPGSRTKNGLTNIVPLSPQAVRILEKHIAALKVERQKRSERGDYTSESPFVFPNRLLIKHSDAPITHIRKATGRIWRNLGIESFSAHDLRRTFATRLGQLHVPTHVIARILNHKQTDITNAVYNQYEYLKEKREGLDAWGAKLLVLVSELVEVHPAKA